MGRRAAIPVTHVSIYLSTISTPSIQCYVLLLFVILFHKSVSYTLFGIQRQIGHLGAVTDSWTGGGIVIVLLHDVGKLKIEVKFPLYHIPGQ